MNEYEHEFDQIAAEQGWNEASQLRILREFISRRDLWPDLAVMAEGVAFMENDGGRL